MKLLLNWEQNLIILPSGARNFTSGAYVVEPWLPELLLKEKPVIVPLAAIPVLTRIAVFTVLNIPYPRRAMPTIRSSARKNPYVRLPGIALLVSMLAGPDA
jgi:hypothetical protein